ARPPDRRERRAHPHDAPLRDEGSEQEARPRDAVHRRRRGGRGGGRALSMARPRHVARGVELFPARTPTLPPATHTNSYALGDREVVLVEPATPYDDERRAWLDWARSFPSQGRRAVAIAVTHHHRDHVGGVEVFARELGL